MSEVSQPNSAAIQHDPAVLASLVESHPCFSKQAHQFARMHLPVAPACNIQCNYCNRKFDCSNETRPGVVSKLLSPIKAAKRFEQVIQRIPETKVVGIAGPGDPLANPAATVATLKAVAKTGHDVHLCVSTNGLQLTEQLPSLIENGVKHLTITINCIDPEIGQKIYPWVYFNQRRLRGLEAAQTLIDQQRLGLEAAIKAGMLVKVNTVLIPGVNDHHVGVLAAELGRYGAFIHNIMPLISDPAHGTFFGLSGQRGPSDEELAAAREQAGQTMPQMSHCQQCRADAIGKLGQDVDLNDIENTAEPVKELVVAVASASKLLIDQHFGHAESFDLYRVSASEVSLLPAQALDQYCQGSEQCDEDSSVSRMDQIIANLSGVDVVLCTRIGPAPLERLESAGIKVSTDYALRNVDAALKQVQQGLQVSDRGCGSTKECG